MKVKELIELLQKCDPKAVVIKANYGDEFEDVNEVIAVGGETLYRCLEQPNWILSKKALDRLMKEEVGIKADSFEPIIVIETSC